MSPMEAARKLRRTSPRRYGNHAFACRYLPAGLVNVLDFGRFLYQFGITAAVAIMVSLLVSFTLTPMMSSRLLRVRTRSHGSEASSRRGFYSFIDRCTRDAVAIDASPARSIGNRIAVIFSSLPLYRPSGRSHPANVDEAEFEVSINAPEGTNFVVMNDAMLAVEEELAKVPGVRLVLASVGGGFISSLNQGDAYIRIAPHDERTFSISRLWRETLNGTPLQAFRGNYSQQDVMQEVRRRLRKFSPLRAGVRNLSSFNFGGGRGDIDFNLRGPEMIQLVRYARISVIAPKDRRHVDADKSLKLNKPELRAEIDRDRAARSAFNTSDIANALRIMIGGDAEVTFHDSSVNELRRQLR